MLQVESTQMRLTRGAFGYGHIVGDEVLKLLASALKARVKGADFVARFGGEEFAILLPMTGLNGAMAVAERIRSDLASRSLKNMTQKADYGSITVSIGAAQHVAGATWSQLLARADRALYRAKSQGRNCIIDLRADDSRAPMPTLMN